MIREVAAFNGKDFLQPIPAICRGNLALHPCFDQEFGYVVHHIPTGRFMIEAGTRNAALKALRELDSLHSWDFSDAELITKVVGEELLIKARSIASEAFDSLPDDAKVHPIYRIRKTIERRMRQGKFVSEELRAQTLDEYMEALGEDY